MLHYDAPPTVYAEALSDFLRARFTGKIEGDLHPIALREARDGTSIKAMIERSLGGGELNGHEFVRALVNSNATFLFSEALNFVIAGNLGHSEHRVLCATRDVPNFKTVGIATVHVGDIAASALGAVPSPVPAINVGGAGVTGQISLYSAGVNVARELLINDDVDAVNAGVQEAARALLREEAKLFAETLEGTSTLADGDPLFGATNSFTGGAPSVTSLDSAADMLATQANSEGAKANAPLNSILIPSTKIATVSTLNQALGGKLKIVSSPFLSGSYWYGFSDPTAQPAVARLRLSGRDVPTVEERRDLRYDGVQFRIEHACGFRPFDRRGVVRVAFS